MWCRARIRTARGALWYFESSCNLPPLCFRLRWRRMWAWWASHSAPERTSASIPRYVLYPSVADRGSGAFLTPGSEKKIKIWDLEKKISKSYIRQLSFNILGKKNLSSLLRIRCFFYLWIRIRDTEHEMFFQRKCWESNLRLVREAVGRGDCSPLAHSTWTLPSSGKIYFLFFLLTANQLTIFLYTKTPMFELTLWVDSVADLDLGCGAFLAPGSGIGFFRISYLWSPTHISQSLVTIFDKKYSNS